MTYLNAVSSVAPRPAQASRTAGHETSSIMFADVLRGKIDGVKFSAHAVTRMSSRGIDLTPAMMQSLEKAVSGVAAKGARESLVMMKNCAFIVNIPNRTVVTAMDGESMKSNIFTNIDSAVIAD